MSSAFPRWLAVAALLAVFGTLSVVRAQPASGTYGVELRGAGDGSRIEARVGPDTAQSESFHATALLAKSPQPLTVSWSAREVSVTIGGQSVRYPATWRVGNAVRISARGNVRASIGVLGGRRVDKIIAGTPIADGKSELIVSGAYLTKSWTLDGAIDWPDEPTPADALMVTTTNQDPPALGEDPKNRQTFTGGVADPFVFSPPNGIQRRSLAAAPVVTLTWTGNAGGQNARRWSVPANWQPQRVPIAGDVVEFPSSANERAPINDLTGDPALGGIIVSARSYELTGNGLKLSPNSSSQIAEDFRVDSLEGSGTIELVGQTVFTVGPRNTTPAKASTTFSGTVVGSLGELVKDGKGELIFAGDASGISQTTAEDGSFALANGARVSALTVNNRAGTFGGLPGTAYSGSFNIDNADYLETIGPGGHGLLKVTGDVDISVLGSTTLQVNLAAGYVPPSGVPIIIIQNDGTDPSAGRNPNDYFRDTDNRRLLEGDTFVANGVTFQISYKCNAEETPAACDGTGNDIGFFPTNGAVTHPDLMITKTPAAQTIVQGGTGTFTLTVTNVGTAATTGSVTVTDTLPAGFTALSVAPGSGWGCDLSNTAVPACTRNDALSFTPGSNAYPPIVLTVHVAENAATGTRTNTATVQTAGDTNSANNSATADVTVTAPGPAVNLQITKTALPTTFERGGAGQYIIVVSNPAGGTPSSGAITVTDMIPTDLTLTGVTAPAPWSCNNTSPVTCTHPGPVPAGASLGSITLNVAVPASTTAASVTNTANLSGGGDPDGASASVTTPIVGSDLTIVKSQPNTFVAGQTGVFTLTVANAGPGATHGTVTVTDTLPIGLTPTGPTGTVNGWACNVSGQTVTCSRTDSIGAAAYPAITLSVSVAQNVPSNLRNTATVSGGGDSTPNSSTIDVAIQNAAPVIELHITKSHAGTVSQGAPVTFTVDVSNLSLAATSGTVTVTDPLPSILSPTSATGAGWTCTIAQTVTCTMTSSLASETHAPLTIAATVSASAVGDFTNTAVVSGGGDVNSHSATDNFTVNEQRQPNLIVAKTHTGNFAPGQTNATFSIVVTNQGAVRTSGTVTVSDTIPAGLTPTSASGPGWTCDPIQGQHVECRRQDALAPGLSYDPITIVASVALTAQSGANIATVSGGGDSTPADSPPDNYTVVETPRLAISKSHQGDFFVGQQGATYTVIVRNVGTAPTSGEVFVDDPIPQGMTPVSAGGPGWTCDPIEAQTVVCHRNDPLAQQQSYPALTITVNVGPVALTTTNIATASGGGDTQPSPSGPDPTTIAGRPQLTIIKSHPDPVIQGERGLPFSLLVSNNGSGPTTGTVTVTDMLPAGLALVDASGSGWNCVIAGATATCSRSDALTQAQSYPAIQIRADVAAGATSTVNDATVSGGGDTTPNDNVAHDSVPISPAGQPNLTLAKEHDGDFTQGQQAAQYRLRVTNSGQAPTVGLVTVTDNLPAALTPTSASGSGWTCTIASQLVTCTRSDALAPGAAYPLIVLLVNVAATATDVVNTASLTGGGDQTAVDNASIDETHIVARAPDLSVVKRHADPFLGGQQSASYHITVTNVGTAPTVGEVVVVDPMPAGLTPVSASGSGWSCAVATRTVTCRRSDSLASGASFPDITLLVNVDLNASNLTNIVSVSGGGDTTPDNNTDSDNTSINVPPDPTISLSRATSLVVLQDAEYQVVVTNLGPGLLGGKTQVDTVLPAELAPLSALGDGWSCTTNGQHVVCTRIGQCLPNNAFSTILIRALVRQGPTSITVTAKVANDADSNPNNNVAVNTGDSVLPASSMSIVKKTTTPRVEIGGVAGYEIDVTNTGEAILLNAVVHDLLPRGFALVKSSTSLRSATRSRQTTPSDTGDGNIEWPIDSLAPGETLALVYQAIAGAGTRSGPQANRATVDATGPLNAKVTAGPAIATVEVTTEVFTMLQSLVGRVFEDVDGNGLFGGGDRPLANARVITSTGQAALTDAAGLYNIPSIGSGTVAVSLDRDTIPAGLTVDDGPGGRSWTRMLRTPIGGGTLLTQNFPLRRAASAPTTATIPTTPPAAAEVNRVPDDPAAGSIPPRRDYQTRQGSSLFIGLGEVSFGRAAQESELFQKDQDATATGSVFYQGTVGSPKNQLTFAADSRRRLNGTTDQDRLFELDPNDRMYPLFGDDSQRQEFATANSKVFARLERGASHVMWGDLIGDLPSSATDGGNWSSYQRHLTGVEVRVANAKGDNVTVRGAQPETAYAREVFAGGQLGLITLGHIELLQGTETVALEVRDRRLPDRVIERDVLARGVDYQLEPTSGTLFLQRNVSGLDPQLNLVQLVVTYEYQNQGIDHMVFNGRAAGTYRTVRGGVTFFTEEGVDNSRFTVAGLDLAQSLPRGGRWRLDLPYSHGTPNVASSVDTQPVDAGSNTDGFAIQADIEQPVEFWSGVLRASFLHADDSFRNPFSATITPGAGYASASAELSPWTPSRVRFGGTYERYNTTSIDATRSTLSAEWAQTIGKNLTLKAGYDDRSLDQSGSSLDSGLFTGQALVKAGDNFQARIGREQNVKDETDPTYPDQTTLGARWKVKPDTSLFYTQRISDAAIVPVGDFATTGFSQLGTKGELNVGVESHVQDATQLTSGYRVEEGINGPDAYAMIGVLTHVKLGRGLGTSFGLEHGQLVSGPDDSYTSGSLAIDWLPSNRFKATTRYEGRNRGAYASLFTAGAAARLYAGFTGLARIQWTSSDQTTTGAGKAFMAALALRPSTNDRLGWLLSYQFVDRGLLLLPTVAPGNSTTGWRHLLSTDGYVQPLQMLELHGKFTWQQTDDLLGLSTDTYLWQGRAQVMLSKRFDGAIEQRYIWQPVTDSHRNGTALEVGFWPIADARVALGYNFHDTRDPYGRDLQGRDKGVYVTLSTKLSYLFDLFGSRPPVAAERH
jgi:uncharacterized repeat protein (TIGR01451 family)